jgi:hypothetical protein
MRDDIAQLRRWARQGVRVTSALPLLYAVVLGKLGIVLCLVQELGAEVNQADEGGYTPLYVAAQEAQLGVVRCNAWSRTLGLTSTKQIEKATSIYMLQRRRVI